MMQALVSMLCYSNTSYSENFCLVLIYYFLRKWFSYIEKDIVAVPCAITRDEFVIKRCTETVLKIVTAFQEPYINTCGTTQHFYCDKLDTHCLIGINKNRISKL